MFAGLCYHFNAQASEYIFVYYLSFNNVTRICIEYMQHSLLTLMFRFYNDYLQLYFLPSIPTIQHLADTNQSMELRKNSYLNEIFFLTFWTK